MSAKAGLVGIYQPPTLQVKSNSVYMVADENNNSLQIFILYPGAYETAYEIAASAWYRNVFIIPVSLDALYVSDVARLANDLYKIKNTVKVLFPGEFCAFVPTAVQKCLINSGKQTYYQYKNGVIAFDYKYKNSGYQPNFHDIYVTFKTRRMLFCPFEVDKTRILNMLADNLVDWVYVPYSDPMFGSDSYATLLNDDRFTVYMNKIIAMGFFNSTQSNYCKGRYPYSYPRTIRNEFLRSDRTTETGNPPVVGGKVTIESKYGTIVPEDEGKTILPERVPQPILPTIKPSNVIPPLVPDHSYAGDTTDNGFEYDGSELDVMDSYDLSVLIDEIHDSL